MMKLKVIKIKTSGNKFSNLSTDMDFTNLEYSTSPKLNRLYFVLYFTDTDTVIKADMWVVVTNYEDGNSFTERCKSVANEDGRLVFYGEEGTRCLLADCETIIASSDVDLVNEVAIINEDFVQEYANTNGSIYEVQATLNDANTHPNDLTIVSKNYLSDLEFDENSDLPF